MKALIWKHEIGEIYVETQDFASPLGLDQTFPQRGGSIKDAF